MQFLIEIDKRRELTAHWKGLTYLLGERFQPADKRKCGEFGVLDNAVDFETLLRLYFPDDFSEFKIPRLTIMGYKG